MELNFLSYILAPIIGAIIFAATGGATPPDLTGIAAIITASVGVIGFLATLIRGRANNKRVEEVEEAASYVKGFEALIKRLQEEIDGLHREISTERQRWADEKAALVRTIGDLRSELQEKIAKNTTTQAELVELRGQIRGFLSADEYKEFKKHAR